MSQADPRGDSDSPRGREKAAKPAVMAVLPKVMYFVNTCAGVPWGRYKLVYFMTLGLNARQIGMIRSATHLSKLVTWPLWGALADRLGCIRTTLLLSLGCATVALETMRQIGSGGPGLPLPFLVIAFVAVVRSSANAGWPLVDSAILALVQRSQEKPSRRPLTAQVVSDSAVRSRSIAAPKPTMLDGNVTVEVGENVDEPKENNSEGYGKQRLWGAIAWGAATLFSGTMIDYIGFQSMFYITYMCVAFEVFVSVLWLPHGLKMKQKPAPPPAQGSGWCGSTSWSRPLVMFYVNLLLYSIVHAIPEQILIMELERHGVPRTWQGALSAATVLLEIPVLFHSDALIGRYGYRKMFFIAQAACIGRLFLLLWTPAADIASVFVAQVLHGVTFGLVWCAAVPYGQCVAPPGNETFTQTLICTIWGTMGQAFGSILWGYLYDMHGADVVYTYGVALTVFILAALSYPRGNWLTGCPSMTPCVVPLKNQQPNPFTMSARESTAVWKLGDDFDRLEEEELLGSDPSRAPSSPRSR